MTAARPRRAEEPHRTSNATSNARDAAPTASTPAGLLSYKRESVIAWRDSGRVQFRAADGRWLTACQLPLVGIRQLVVDEGAIFVVGAVDEVHAAVLHADQKCLVLQRWD